MLPYIIIYKMLFNTTHTFSYHTAIIPITFYITIHYIYIGTFHFITYYHCNCSLHHHLLHNNHQLYNINPHYHQILTHIIQYHHITLDIMKYHHKIIINHGNTIPCPYKIPQYHQKSSILSLYD